GEILKSQAYTFDIGFTSVLKRAIKTLDIILDELDLLWIPVQKSWRLNERFYGALQGLNKGDTEAQYGKEQVHKWRRDPYEHPPAITKEDPRYPGFDVRYRDLNERELPLTENLSETMNRVLPYWHQVIAPLILENKKIIISAHGNSLRALVKYLDQLSDQEVINLEIPTGIPLVYELDDQLKKMKHTYLR
ncbi:MAG TPA: 2,3-bisphosphoglycerate-dependent phosphoglycerate mutase, partial [Daejeonella sp.]|nr:2,3-bisphosphoglycerate-dependent phosphoglycerate mutase [Daejeonella sp.]